MLNICFRMIRYVSSDAMAIDADGYYRPPEVLAHGNSWIMNDPYLAELFEFYTRTNPGFIVDMIISYG